MCSAPCGVCVEGDRRNGRDTFRVIVADERKNLVRILQGTGRRNCGRAVENREQTERPFVVDGSQLFGKLDSCGERKTEALRYRRRENNRITVVRISGIERGYPSSLWSGKYRKDE